MLETPYWWDAAPPVLEEPELPDRVPVAIVGGGYTGLSAALTLSRLGHRVMVLDAERIGWGASSRNGGMVSGGIKVASSSLPRSLGADGARQVALDAAASFGFIEELIAREGIDCDYRRVGRFSPAWTRGHLRAMAEKVNFLAEITGMQVRIVPEARQRSELGSDFYRGGMVVEAAGGLHPGRYASGLAGAAARAGAILAGGTRVSAIRPAGECFRLATSRGELQADAVLVATNGYSAGGPMPWLA
jgi:glycine/D-amino acid oxidase-like deaminating enzyme